MRKTLSAAVLAVVLGAFVVPSGTFAQTSTQALFDQIKALLGRVQELQNQINQLEAQKQGVGVQISDLLTTLKQGDEGEKVTTLQALLAADTEIYPQGLITGFYGNLTSQAVKRFQKRHGIETVGIVGPKTLKKLNELYQKYPVAIEISTSTGERRPCAIVPPGHLIAPGWLKKNAPPVVPTCQVLPPGILKKLVQATTTPDTAPPVISSIAAQNVTANAAAIVWTTNELATSKIYYGTTSPLNLTASSTTVSTGSSSVTNHAVGLSGLSASTTYYYVVESQDVSSNVATSSQQSFITTAQADTTAPVITSQSVTPATSSAVISWVTNETSDSQINYGISTAYGLATALNIALVTNHSQTLAGLTPSMAYFFQIRSRDAALNLGISTGQFTTPALPDTTAPAISAVLATGVASSTATVNWTTDEAATSKVFYGTAFPVDTNTAPFVSSVAFLSAHSVPLTGLNASTTYYYTVQSQDASANVVTSATSSQQFTTTGL